MDTKWKKSKRWIGFTAFFLGLTLFLGNLLHIIAMIAGGITTEDMKDAFQPDYQNTSAFQFYMEGYLEDFLSMASGGKVDFSWNNDSRTRGISYSSYYGVESFGYGGDGNIAVVGIQGDLGKTSASYVTVTSSEGASDSVAAEASDEQSAGNDVVAENTSDWSVQNSEASESTDSAEAESSNAAVAGTSSQDQKEENRRAADEAHEMLKDCKNLLYTITYDDKELYSNAGDLQLNGEEHLLPEGYNFLLYFDGSKVYIQKDGRELDIYGNGIYTDNGSWFVPGYENFAVDDKYKDARITIAAAEDPKQYTVAVYGPVSYTHLDVYKRQFGFFPDRNLWIPEQQGSGQIQRCGDVYKRQGAHLELRRVVERGGGLVQEQQARALDHGGGDVEAQLLAAGEGARVELPQALVQVEVAQHALGLGLGAGALVGAVGFERALQHDVAGRLARQRVQELGDIAQLEGAQVEHLALGGLREVDEAEAGGIVQDCLLYTSRCV